MNRQATLGIVIAIFATSLSSTALGQNKPAALDHDVSTLAGEEINLADKYKDQVVLLVNVASKCGLTPQYGALQALHEEYADQGLAIVGIPCNQFGGQEPGNADEISTFCEQNYGVEFDLLSKADVNGENACSLYKFLTSENTNPEFAGDIKWNFEKFLLSRAGEVVARFKPRAKPDSREVVDAIEAELVEQPASVVAE